MSLQALIGVCTESSNPPGGTFEEAFIDIRMAFEMFLEAGAGPLVLAGHSQGAVMINRLMDEFCNPGALAD